eukprot:Clim_evm25s231 gene=Clim_evmTU25s231
MRNNLLRVLVALVVIDRPGFADQPKCPTELTDEWVEIPDGCAVPAGGEYKLSMNGGPRMARKAQETSAGQRNAPILVTDPYADSHTKPKDKDPPKVEHDPDMESHHWVRVPPIPQESDAGEAAVAGKPEVEVMGGLLQALERWWTNEEFRKDPWQAVIILQDLEDIVRSHYNGVDFVMLGGVPILEAMVATNPFIVPCPEPMNPDKCTPAKPCTTPEECALQEDEQEVHIAAIRTLGALANANTAVQDSVSEETLRHLARKVLQQLPPVGRFYRPATSAAWNDDEKAEEGNHSYHNAAVEYWRKIDYGALQLVSVSVYALAALSRHHPQNAGIIWSFTERGLLSAEDDKDRQEHSQDLAFPFIVLDRTFYSAIRGKVLGMIADHVRDGTVSLQTQPGMCAVVEAALHGMYLDTEDEDRTSIQAHAVVLKVVEVALDALPILCFAEDTDRALTTLERILQRQSDWHPEQLSDWQMELKQALKTAHGKGVA